MKKIILIILIVAAGVWLYIYFKNSKQTRTFEAPAPQTQTEQTAAKTATATPPTLSPINTTAFAVGYTERHPQITLGQLVLMQGYMLKAETGYVYFSDEKTGPIGPGDLPVAGLGAASFVPNHLYTITGTLVEGGLTAGNGNKYHFELKDILK